MNTLETFKAAKKATTDLISRLKADTARQSKEVFALATKELFEKHPILESFSWTQFTPYFNDGDTCTFSSQHADYLNITWTDGTADDDLCDWDILQKEKRGEPITIKDAAFRDVFACMDVFDDDDVLALFGDHVQVTISRDGISVDEYDDHD